MYGPDSGLPEHVPYTYHKAPTKYLPISITYGAVIHVSIGSDPSRNMVYTRCTKTSRAQPRCFLCSRHEKSSFWQKHPFWGHFDQTDDLSCLNATRYDTENYLKPCKTLILTIKPAITDKLASYSPRKEALARHLPTRSGPRRVPEGSPRSNTLKKVHYDHVRTYMYPFTIVISRPWHQNDRFWPVLRPLF